MTTVRTKGEFERAAAETDVDEIRVEGELAETLARARSRRKTAGISAGIIAAAAIAAMPFTAGTSGLIAAGAISAGGVGAAVAVLLGVGFATMLFQHWDEVEFNWGPPPSARFRRKPK